MSDMSSTQRRIQNRRKQMIRLFNEHGNLSKNDIFKLTHYSISTVLSTVDGMFEDGLIEPVDSFQSSVGRPALYYSLRPEHGYVVGIDINSNTVNLALINFKRELTQTLSRHIPQEKHSLQAVVDWLPELIDELTLSVKPPVTILCIGIAAPGLVDLATGRIIYYSGFPGEENVELVSPMEAKYNCRVFVDKSLNCLATAYEEQAPQKIENMLLISMRTGVGMSCILGGNTYRGSNGLAGEIGYMRIPASSQGLRNINEGTLDTELSIYSIAQKLDLTFGETTDQNGQPVSAMEKVKLFVELVKNGQPDCLRILDELCFTLAYCVRQLVHLLDPSDVLFYGEITQCGDIFLDRLKNYFSYQNISAQPTRLGIAKLSRFAFAEGAAYYAFNQYLMPGA